MIIKPPSPADIPALRRLWQAAFGDTEAFIDSFFRTGFSENRCLLAQKDGQLLAALYWFDCLWEGKKLAYLYAIATNEQHRGRGICTALMARTHALLAENGCCGAILVPADDTLARMYGKMGYVPCCPVASPAGNGPTKTDEISPAEYEALRAELLPKGGVQHTTAAFSYLAGYTKFYRFPGGICCGWQAEGKLQLQELLPPGDNAPTRSVLYLPFTQSATHPTYFALDMG